MSTRMLLHYFLGTAVILLSIVIANEAYNCEKMMIYKNLPYHVAIEIIGFALFISLSLLFLKWESYYIRSE